MFIVRIMPLEDHAGDVIAKSRKMKGIAVTAVAASAGLSAAELAAYEEDGILKTELQWASVAELLDLDGSKLKRVAQGWVPPLPNLSDWREFRQITTTGPTMDVHAYLVWDEATKDAAIFDTGFDPQPIFDIIEAEGLNPLYLFITHMHGDHVAGLQAIRSRFPKIGLRSDSRGAPAQCRNRRDEFLQIGNLRVSNRDTPGHAEDGVTYVIGGFPDTAPSIAIVGDAIFAGSMGGAPVAGELAKSKVREQIMTLPDDTLLGPGHGPLTCVGSEKENNPFF